MRTTSSDVPSGASQNSRSAFVEKKNGSPSLGSSSSKVSHPGHTRGFTCSQVKVDPKVATPAEIARARKMAIGHQIDGLTGGLEAK